MIAAAEHTVALMLALARNIPQAHAALVDGRWERSKFGGFEVYEKTIGILGFGRIGQLVAQRAQGFDMRVIAYDPFVSPSASASSGVERHGVLRRPLRARRHHHDPPSEDTRDPELARRGGVLEDEGRRAGHQLRARAAARRRCARRCLGSGKVAGAALDVFREEPITEHPLFGIPGVS